MSVLPFTFQSLCPLGSACGGVQYEDCTLDLSRFTLETDYKYEAERACSKATFTVIEDLSKVPLHYDNIFFDLDEGIFIMQDNEGHSYGTFGIKVTVDTNGTPTIYYFLRSWEPNEYCYSSI